MIKTGVVNRNFIRFLKAGAFGVADGETEPMSEYKWNVLFDAGNVHNVGAYIIRGAEMHSDDRWFNCAASLSELKEQLSEVPDINRDIDRILRMGVKDVDGMYTSLSNVRLRHMLGKIIYNEIHSDETNLPALHLLCIIVYNINVTLTHGMKMEGLVTLGSYLREKGDRADFVKLESWLSTLMMSHFANLLGNMLVLLFDFDEGEIPFMHGRDDNAPSVLSWTFDNVSSDSDNESYFVQLSSGFIANDRTVIRRNLKRGLRYMRYYPLETVSNFFSKFFKNLPVIEE